MELKALLHGYVLSRIWLRLGQNFKSPVQIASCCDNWCDIFVGYAVQVVVFGITCKAPVGML